MRPEIAHDLGVFALRRSWLWRWTGSRYHIQEQRLRVVAGGIEFPNPVGLAAGFDKDCTMLESLGRLGFGYLVPGSIMPDFEPNNPRPNLHRLMREESLINCVGLASKGALYCVQRLEALAKSQKPAAGFKRPPVIANISGYEVEGLVRAYQLLAPLVEGVEFTLLCPNVDYTVTTFLERGKCGELLRELAKVKTKPLFIKIRNYHSEAEREGRMELVRLCMQYRVDGLTLPGSLTVQDAKLSIGRGNLSGRKIFQVALQNVADLYTVTGGQTAIKALGGISTGADAFRMIAAGASNVEILTSFFYRGPGAAREINRELLTLLEQRGINSVQDLRGLNAEEVRQTADRGLRQVLSAG